MKIDGATEIYGIVGWPVSHSLSPLMHNAAFDHCQLNKVYIPLPVKNMEKAMVGIRALHIQGASVTIPHKQAVIPYLDSIDRVAERIGAVNTLVVGDDGAIKGCNTDWLGANRAIAEHMDMAGKTAFLLGAGGSARAIGFGLLEAGVNVTLVNRTRAKGEALAAELDCPFMPLAEFAGNATVTADILVNATSIGMAPYDDVSPLDFGMLENFHLVMDIVYSPLQTRLLREAAAKGCICVNGLSMLLYQGVVQFELWTGEKAPVAIMQDTLYRATGNI